MSAQPARVLLIDDDEDDYVLTRDLFAEINDGAYVLDWVSDYDAGLQAMCRSEHVVYLLDYRLGPRTGVELLREAAQSNCLGPTIFLTGQGEREVDLEAMRAGATDYLEKGNLSAAVLDRSIRYAQVHWKYQSELEARVAERTAELLRVNDELRESEERLHQALINAPVPVMLLDNRERILLFSHSWLDVTGYREDDLQTLQDWVTRAHPDEPEAALARFREIISSPAGREPVEFSVRTAGGGLRAWSFAASRLGKTSDERSLVVCIASDITERKQAEEILRDADRRKDEFLAMLAHELRNPLAPIRTGLEVLKLAGDDPQTSEVRGMMERQTQHMTRLIDDLLDVSRITRGKLALHKSRVDLAEVIQNAVEATRPFIAEEKHQLDVTLPAERVEIEADPVRIAQVVSNLLHNAAKYTNRGGRIWLEAKRRQTEVEITITDTGYGIPAEMQQRIFEMFSQIDRLTETGYTGLGIGLTLVKALVEMHGGSVTVQSEGPGTGSRFSVRLPVLEPTGGTSANSVDAPQAVDASKKRILVVDDNEDSASAMGMMLEMLGNDVHLAFDGQQAVEDARRFRPQLILMDLGMPRVTGYEAARTIKKQTWGEHMVLVAMTGWGQDSDRQRARQAGFDHHLIKPIEPSKVKDLLAHLNDA